MKLLKTTIALATLATLAGCATGNQYNPNIYHGSQANVIGGYQTGVVTGVRAVAIQDNTSGVGAVSGAVIGGLIGSSVGGGSGARIATAVGAVGGGVVGNSAESGARRTQAQEITVRLSNGSEIVVVQGNDLNIQSGERVRLMSHNGHFRVIR